MSRTLHEKPPELLTRADIRRPAEALGGLGRPPAGGIVRDWFAVRSRWLYGTRYAGMVARRVRWRL